jgi:DNA polymerase-1
VPDNAPAIEALLAGLLTEQEQQAWPRTPRRGKLSTRRACLAEGAAAYPLLKALVDIGRIEKQLNTYGERLAAQISPVTGRIHASYRVAGAISGRSSCSKPNMQNIPDTQPVEGLPSFRTLFVAREGYTFVGGDWTTMEMRAAAHIAADEAMTQAFERGEDLHARTARTMLRLDEAGWLDLPKNERSQHRKHAKPVNFGRIYGQEAAGLVASAREQYGLVLDLATAEAWIRAFQEAYPDFTRWAPTFARAAKRSGCIPIGREGGRIHEIHWNPGGRYRYTQCLNLPIQGALRRRLHAGTDDDRRNLVRGRDRGWPGRGAARRDRAGTVASRCRAGCGSPTEGDDHRLRRDLPWRAAARPRRGADRPVLGGDQVVADAGGPVADSERIDFTMSATTK